jgi:hypothetical protein
MGYLYFDESMRDQGGFIVGALVLSRSDLSQSVHDLWSSLGLDPDKFEYKSSRLKGGDPLGQQQRDALREVLFTSQLALTVCPRTDRSQLGSHCLALTKQLLETGFLRGNVHRLYVDQNITVPQREATALASRGVATYPNQDSRILAGLQVADHAAHALGGMLLEEMGLIQKTVAAGPDSGYEPDLAIELGFELWAGLRYALLGKNEAIEGLSTPGDPVNPYFRVDGYGLYIAPSCTETLAKHARACFGVNYLGCTH